MGIDRCIPNETKFIISCARRFILSDGDNNTIGKLDEELSVENLDWKQVIAQARRHRLISLISKALHRFPIVYPRSFIEELKFHNVCVAKKSLAQTAELCRLVAAFQAKGIDFVLLKGVPLAQELYRGLTNRTSHDIDLLVNPRDAYSAFACLFDLGYENTLDRETLCKRSIMSRFRFYSHKDVSFFLKHQRILLELHWRVAGSYGSFPVPSSEIIKYKRAVNVLGTDLPVMSKEVTALFLCYHGSVHQWSRLHWLCDMALLFRQGDMDWEWIVAEAKRLGVLPCLGMAVVLVRDVLKTPVAKVLFENQELLEAGIDLAPKTLPVIFQESVNEMVVSIESLSWILRLQTHYINRIRILLKLLCPSDSDKEFFNLPDRLAGLYCIGRPFRLLYRKFRI